MMRISQALNRTLFSPVDIAPLVFFRVAFGGLMLWEVWRYFHFDRISRYYVEPIFYFHYYGFDWLRPLPGDGMFWLFHGIGLLSVLIMLGAAYRLSMAVFWVCFTYIFLLDQAQYLNHFYLISLISFLMIFVPAHRALSVDALLRPSLRSAMVPGWSLWLLRGQMALVYIFGGLAKINPDWLVGEPLREWMADVTDFPVIGVLFTEEWMVYLFSYGGLLLDLLVVPLLLWRRTRIPALLLAVGFHMTNARLFNIGIFPWFAIAATLLFLPPHWFRLALRLPVVTPEDHQTSYGVLSRRLVLAGMLIYFAVQILLPLRHWLYPGDVSWTEEGHTLAWHMRLRDKDGDITFYAGDRATGSMWQIEAEAYLTRRQFTQMKDNPRMILLYAHYLADVLAAEGYTDVEIRTRSMMAHNSRTPQLLIDPTADLTRERDELVAADWILPLVQEPAPHPGVPALLVSRRYEGVLLLVNITEGPFPLRQLMVQIGDVQIAGEAFGPEALMADECVLVYEGDADFFSFFVPCNESGNRVRTHSRLADSQITLHVGEATADCDGVVCVVRGSAGGYLSDDA